MRVWWLGERENKEACSKVRVLMQATENTIPTSEATTTLHGIFTVLSFDIMMTIECAVRIPRWFDTVFFIVDIDLGGGINLRRFNMTST